MGKAGIGILLMLSVLVGAAEAGTMKCVGRVSASGNLEKKRDSSKKESSNSSSKSKTEIQCYDLKITAANTGKMSADFEVEWYFFKRKLDNKGDKGDPVLAEKGKETVTLQGMKRQVIPVRSKELKWSETKSSKSSSKKNSNTTSKTTISGDVYCGYVVLLRVDGEVISRYSPDRKFTTDEWLEQMSVSL